MTSIDQNHLSEELFFLTLDDELSSAQRLECEAHLAVCLACSRKLASLHEFSAQVQTAVQSVPVPKMDSVRSFLQSEMGPQNAAAMPDAGKVMRRFAWGMSIAATLAFGLLMTPRHYWNQPGGLTDVSQVSAAQASVIEVDGEAFFPVPYSNAELSTSAPHIVQMQVPVSSLADIGIVFEPVMNRVSGAPEAERSVLADVLVGADGQPRGVHVLGLE